MRRILALLGMLAILFPTAGRTQGIERPTLLTLDRAIALAESHNRQLAVADARLTAAEAEIYEARSHRLPRIDLVGGLQRTDNPAMVFSKLLGQESFTAENFELGTLNRPDPLSNWKSGVTLELPLWSGGRIAGGIESARQRRDGVTAERESSRQQVVREVTASYATAVLTTHQLAVAREALETATAHVALTADLWRSGLVVESDVLLAQVRESEVHETLIRAESGVEISRAALNLVLGRDLSTAFALPETLELRDDPEADLEALIASARAHRPDLQAAHERRAAAGSEVGVAQAGHRPQLGLQAGYETNAEDFFGRDGDNWTLGLGFRVPLFEGFSTRARVARARAHQDEAEELAELLEQSAELEVRQTYHQLRAARQQLVQAAKGAELARRSLVIVQDRYKEGLTTLPELLDTETALTGARLRQVAAHRQVLTARADLDLAIGSL